MRILFFVMILICRAEGDDVPQEMKALVEQSKSFTKQAGAAKSISNEVTSHPEESSLYNVHSLEGAASGAVQKQEHAQTFVDMMESRPYFQLDSEKDPLFKQSAKATNDADSFLKEPLYNRKPRTTYAWKTCQESREKTKMTCSKILLEPSIHIEPAKYAKWWCSAGNHEPDDPKCRAKTEYNPPKKYRDEVVTVTDEDWTNGCHALEKKQKKGICRLIKKVCPKGKEEREIHIKSGGTDKDKTRLVTRDCWRWESTYECDVSSVNSCEALRQSSCEQMNSKCLKDIAGECVEWEQVYRCPKDVKPDEKDLLSKKGFVPEDSKVGLPYEQNSDMNEAIAKLNIFKEIQEEMRKDGVVESIKVFKGNHKQCTIAFAGFKNCCAGMGGWGKVFGNGCNEEDKQLAADKGKGLCHEVGTYCAEKVIVCIRKKKSHCCFGSKLSRIIHEQGRKQLGIGWGSAEQPNCRGFTPEELSRLNFDELNLSEVYSDIHAKVDKRMAAMTSKVVNRNLHNRVQTMTKGFGNKTPSGDF